MNSPEENPFSISDKNEEVVAEEAIEAPIVPDQAVKAKQAERLKDLPPNTVMMIKLIGWTLAMTLILLVIVICSFFSSRIGTSEIRTYEATKFAVLNPPSHRMLAAIRMGETEAWFFKVVGETSALDAKADEIKEFFASVKMDSRTSKPSWRTPAGWTSEGETRMRFATLRIPSGEETLELSISSLGINGNTADNFLLLNVNRWRKQLEIDELDSFELADQTSEIEIDGVTSTWIDYSGRYTSSMPKASPGPTPRPGPRPGPAAPQGANASLAYKAPPGWNEDAAGGFRKASFSIPNEVDKMEVSVIDLPGNSGGLVANIRRWRGQAGIPSDEESISNAEVLAEAVKINIDGIPSHYVNLSGPEKTILGAIVDRNGYTWFIKLTGPTKPAVAEEARFKEFLKTIHFK
jgi:hypothetical protein